MVEQDEIICKISKSGPNLMAWIPADKQGRFSRGDKVNITLIEKATILNEQAIKSELQEFLKATNGAKLTGKVMGYSVEIPIIKFLRNMPRAKAEKILCEAILK